MAKVLEEEIYGEVPISKNKIIGEFVEKYIIIALIPWVIYRIGIFIITDLGSEEIQKQQYSINSILDYYNLSNELSYKILIFSIIIVLMGFLVVILSSKFVLRKYKIKKEYINSIMRAIVVIQIIFFCITSFYYFVSYNDRIRFNYALESKFEWLANKENKKNPEKYDVKKYISDLNSCFQINMVLLLAVNLCCVIFEVVLQKKILENYRK